MAQKKQAELLSKNYLDFLQTIKQRIRTSRIRAYRTVVNELIDLYWDIGREIAQRQEREGWGKAIVERLSDDLQKEFSGTSGFSTQNLWFMRKLYLEYSHSANLLQLVREVPWGQNISIMTKIKDYDARAYYLRMTTDMGWSRSVLLHQIKTDAHRRYLRNRQMRQ